MTKVQEIKLQTELTEAHGDYGKGLNSYAFFKIHNHETGKDLVQDTFMKTWKYLVKGGKIKTMKSFLYHVLNNLIVDEYRKRKNTSLDVLLEKGFEPSTDETERIFDFLDGGKALHLIKYLPKKYQKIMHMRYVQLLSPKEISDIIGQSNNTTAVQTHRELSRLKLLFEQQN